MLTWLVDSFGLKRKLAAVLAILVELARSHPEYSAYISVVEQVAGWLGITGLVHAGTSGSLKVDKTTALSWGALFTGLIAIAHFVPALAPLVPILYKISAALSAYGIGKSVANSKKK